MTSEIEALNRRLEITVGRRSDSNRPVQLVEHSPGLEAVVGGVLAVEGNLDAILEK
jgi:hypothetical protein